MRYLFLVLTFFILSCSTKELSVPKYVKYADIKQKWWEKYESKALNECIKNSLKNSIELKKGMLNIKKSLYQSNISQLDKQIKLDGNLNANYSKNLKNGTSSKSFGSSFSISYELDIWGKLQDSYMASIYEYKATKEDLKALRLSVIRQNIDNFLSLAYINDSLALSRESLENYKKLKEILQTRYRYGKIEKIELNQVNQSIISTQNELLNLQIQKNNELQIYKNLQNIKQANIKPTSLNALTFLKINLNRDFFTLQERPDIKSSALRLKKSFLEGKISEISLYPSISLGANLSSNSSKLEKGFAFNLLGGNMQISLPFLDYKRVKNSIKVSKTQYEINRIDYENSLTKALNELIALHKNYEIQIQIYKNQQKKLNDDIKVTKNYKLKYDLGKDSLSNYLESQNALISSKSSILNQKYQILKLQNQIYLALGGKM